MTRDNAKARWLERIPSIQMVAGDMTDRSSAERALEGVERVLMISSPAVVSAVTVSDGAVFTIDDGRAA